MNARAPTLPLLDDAVSLARALHAAGAPAWRIEQAVARLGESEAVPLDCFAVPTGLQLADGERVRLVRATSGEPDLTAQHALERAVRAPAPRAALRRTLVALDARPALSARTVLLAYASVAAGGALLFDGGVGTLLGATLAGLWVGGLVAWGSLLGDGVARLLPVLAAAGATALVHALSHAVPLNVEVAVIAGLLVLLPGLSLTTGVAEVAEGHLSAGAARMTGAAVALLLLGLGAAGGAGLVAAAPAGSGLALVGAIPLGLWLSVGGLAVLFRASVAQVPWIAVGVATAWVVPHALPGLPPTAVDFLTAATLGLMGGALARQLRQPAQVLTLPGILLLVPGARALAALGALLRHDLCGIEILADSLATSGALVSGLLLASSLRVATRA